MLNQLIYTKLHKEIVGGIAYYNNENNLSKYEKKFLAEKIALVQSFLQFIESIKVCDSQFRFIQRHIDFKICMLEMDKMAASAEEKEKIKNLAHEYRKISLLIFDIKYQRYKTP